MESPEFTYLVQGLGVGFSVAMPVGPIGVICIRRSLTAGRIAGIVCGLGAATSDGLYGCVAAFGLTAISGFFIANRTIIHVLGALYLAWLGFSIVKKSAIHVTVEGAPARGLWRDYIETMILTFTSPMTVLMFIAIFAGLGLTEARSMASSTLMAAGVFMGSALWFVMLGFGMGSVRHRFGDSHLRWVNRISGGVILGFALLIILNEVRRHG